ncbi:MAG TPA: protein phosphatase 2C domain-containing protein [Vicinamibacterales bacterium]
MFRAYGVTERGRIRPTNEDCFAISSQLQLCVVADGMGGHNAGEVAARLAVDAMVDYVAEAEEAGSQRGYDGGVSRWPLGFDPSLSEGGNLLRTAVYLANLRILETAVLSREYAGMGTTIVAGLVRDGRLSVAHVGDSRLYLFADGQLRQLTADDSWAATAIAGGGQPDGALLQHHPMRHALTNVVGARARTEVHVTERVLRGGELLVLTTDGVHEHVDERRIQELMTGSGSVAEIPGALVRSAFARGSRDNCTAVVGEYTLHS